MEIRICDNKADWDSYSLKLAQNLRQDSDQTEFLQSWDWGEFQASISKPAIRLQAVENGEVVWQGLCLEHKLGLGLKYLYVPRLRTYDLGLMAMVDYCKKNNFSFVRIESHSVLRPTSYVLRPIRNRQPRTTLVLDLTQPEETLLANMHAKTRYNISLAERKGVEIREEKNIDVFWELNETTTARDQFKSHDKNYYAKMLEMEMCHQLTAYFQGKPIAAILLIIFGNTCVYLHGASSNEERNLMAPYLLQWKGIKLAMQLSYKYYDFWGIAPAPQKNQPSSCFHNLCWEVGHKWTGVTRFKAGFGGTVREYPQAVDVVLSKLKYSFYKFMKRLL